MSLLRRLAASAGRQAAVQPMLTRTSVGVMRRCASTSSVADVASVADPEMNGGYTNPTRVKRQLRDPYGGWWDKQDRRNFGEPVHDDHDILGTFSPEPYNHFSTGRVLFLNGCFITFVLSISGVAYLTYPDRPAVPRRFPGGLDRELGYTVPALAEEDDS